MQPIYSGKVRDIYDIANDRLVIVTTDRISAFDSILTMPVKDKGVILNKLSNFWFHKTQNIVPNHVIDDNVENMPPYFRNEFFKERTVLVQKLHMLPFEFVVRGYLFGNMWKSYEKGENFCGITLPSGCILAQKLEQPVLTPALKHSTGHDEYVSMQDVSDHLGAKLADRIADICFMLYHTCSEYALSKGFIIADAKFEFGQDSQGQLVLADEIFTPDSSRFWDAANYKTGVTPPSFDKQFLRDWLMDNKVNGAFQFDNVPESVLMQTAKLYQECLRRLVT